MMSDTSTTNAINFPLVVNTKTAQPLARLILRNNLGQVVQQWLVKQNKCTLGSASSCSLRCTETGIAPYHALLVVGARQTFVRALAPKLTRDGKQVNEILLTDQAGGFEIAGHRFELSRSAVDGGSNPESPTTSGRMKFTLARPFELNKRENPTLQSNAAAQAPQLNGEVVAPWVAKLVQSAVEPLECQLHNVLGPLAELQADSRRQKRLRKKRRDAKKQAKVDAEELRFAEPEPETPPAISPELQAQLESIVTRQTINLEALGERISDVSHQLAALDRIAADDAPSTEILEEIPAVRQQVQTQCLAIEQLQAGIVAVSSAIENLQKLQQRSQDLQQQSQDLQQQSQAANEQWKQEIQIQLGTIAENLRTVTEQPQTAIESPEILAAIERLQSIQAQSQQEMEDWKTEIQEQMQTLQASLDDPARFVVAAPTSPAPTSPVPTTSAVITPEPTVPEPTSPAATVPEPTTPVSTPDLASRVPPTEERPPVEPLVESAQESSWEMIGQIESSEISMAGEVPVVATEAATNEAEYQSWPTLEADETDFSCDIADELSSESECDEESAISSPQFKSWDDSIDPLTDETNGYAANFGEPAEPTFSPAKIVRPLENEVEKPVSPYAPPKPANAQAEVHDVSVDSVSKSIDSHEQFGAGEFDAEAPFQPEFVFDGLPAADELVDDTAFETAQAEPNSKFSDAREFEDPIAEISVEPHQDFMHEVNDAEEPLANEEGTADRLVVEESSGADTESASRQLPSWWTEDDADLTPPEVESNSEAFSHAPAEEFEFANAPEQIAEFEEPSLSEPVAAEAGQETTTFEQPRPAVEEFADEERYASEPESEEFFGLTSEFESVEQHAPETDSTYQAKRHPISVPDVLAEADLATSASAPVDAPAADVSAAEAEEEEDSVEDYMRKLLARMRGVPEEEIVLPSEKSAQVATQPPASPAAPVSRPAPLTASLRPERKLEGRKTEGPATVSETNEVTAPFDPEKYVPRVIAPEANQNMAAMRELANSTARTAISKSTRQRHVASVLLKLAIAGVGFVVAVVLLAINGLSLNIGLIATFASIVVAVIWGYDGITSLKPLLQSSLVLNPNRAAVRGEEIE
ncbi:MAG: hypothetical protein R3C53_17100 [Pirellulaceae bacterium]